MAVAETRERILDAAEELFFQRGIAVTGIDRVAEVAGVSVVTVYKHTGSKDGLLAEVLRRRLIRWDEVWQAHIDAVADPKEKVLAVFDAVADFRNESGRTQWCSFLATASERASLDDAPGAMVGADAELLKNRLERWAELADPDRGAEVVAIITLLYNGVLASLLRGVPLDAAAIASRSARQALGWVGNGSAVTR